jgi:hypothetical protein
MNRVGFTEGLQDAELVSDWPSFSVLDVIRPAVALPPLLQAFGGNTKKLSGAIFVEYWVIVAGPHRPRLDIKVRHRNLETMPIGSKRRRTHLRPSDRTGRLACR